MPVFDRADVEAALPSYVIDFTRKLGAGGMADVYAAHHRALNRPAAVKILKMDDSNLESARGASSRFASEGKALAAFANPHVVHVYDYVEHANSNTNILVMELLTGGTLQKRMGSGITKETACGIGLAAAEALDAAHSAKILHRDIKPANMMFAADGTMKITDFGISKLLDQTTAFESGWARTPAYSAPEQCIHGGVLGPGSDLYSLGVVLYEMLAKKHPFAGIASSFGDFERCHREVPPPPAPEFGERVASVVYRVLSKDISDRHGTAREFALALASAANDSFGPDWLSRADVRLHLSDEIRDTARKSAPQLNINRTTRHPGPAPTGAPDSVSKPLPEPRTKARSSQDNKYRSHRVGVHLFNLIASAVTLLGVSVFSFIMAGWLADTDAVWELPLGIFLGFFVIIGLPLAVAWSLFAAKGLKKSIKYRSR